MSAAAPEKHREELKKIGALPDKDIDLGRAALLLSALNHPGLSIDRYHNHIKTLTNEVLDMYVTLRGAQAEDTLQVKIEALKKILVDVHDYHGASENYDDLQNADLIRVIDRRCGMPIALSILYIQVARLRGWEAQGLNIPGHFVVRLDQGGERLIFDPFNDCAMLQAADLRRLVKQALGEKAELSADYFLPATNRTTLVRLQNNIKIRQIENEDYEGALRTVEAMRLVDPGEYRLLLDEGVLSARTGRVQAAAEALEAYIKKAPDDKDRHDAALLLQQIRQSLN